MPDKSNNKDQTISGEALTSNKENQMTGNRTNPTREELTTQALGSYARDLDPKRCLVPWHFDGTDEIFNLKVETLHDYAVQVLEQMADGLMDITPGYEAKDIDDGYWGFSHVGKTIRLWHQTSAQIKLLTNQIDYWHNDQCIDLLDGGSKSFKMIAQSNWDEDRGQVELEWFGKIYYFTPEYLKEFETGWE